MSDLPYIINSDIIGNQNDRYWDEVPPNLAQLNPRQVLVFSLPYADKDAEDALLKKMLQACKLEEDQYHIVQLQPDDCYAWHRLRDQLEPQQVILLGIEPAQLGIAAQFMPHQVSRFNDRSWIATASLQDLMQHQDIKNHLWNYGLKPVFHDKVYG